LEAHPYQSFPTPELISPSCKQTIRTHFPDTQSRSSLWPGSLTHKLEFLTTIFKNNGYSSQQIPRALIPATQTANLVQLGRMLVKHNIKMVTLPPRKIFSYLPPVKDALDPMWLWQGLYWTKWLIHPNLNQRAQ
jgi:hypothetical protein